MTSELSVLLRAWDVRKTFEDGALQVPVLHGVTLSVHAGQLTLLMGPSGSGKTTLISILTGLLRPSSGKVELCGEPISELGDGQVSAVRRRELGFIFQTYNLFPALTARDNVMEVLRLKGMAAGEARKRAEDALGRVGLADRMKHRPGELSGGQKQRVAIARALASKPRVIVGDEVTGALDGQTALSVMEILRDHVTSSSAVLIVTHDHRLERFADRVVELEDGELAADRAPNRHWTSSRFDIRASQDQGKLP